MQRSGEVDTFPIRGELRLVAVGLQRGEQPRPGDSASSSENRVVPGFFIGPRCRASPGLQPGFLVEGGNFEQVDPPGTVPGVS